MTYDPNGFPTVAVPAFSNPNATLNNPNYSVMEIPGVNDPVGSVYNSNQVGFSKTLTINRIFNLLNGMINVLQNAAAAQAQNLNVLTQWQQAYTNTMNQVHSFTTGSNDFYDQPNPGKTGTGVPPKYGSGTTISQNTLTALQSSLNQNNTTYTTELQNERSVISDQSKSMQTSLNQTTDAVNQQTSLATSLLQELSSLTNTLLQVTPS